MFTLNSRQMDKEIERIRINEKCGDYESEYNYGDDYEDFCQHMPTQETLSKDTCDNCDSYLEGELVCSICGSWDIEETPPAGTW